MNENSSFFLEILTILKLYLSEIKLKLRWSEVVFWGLLACQSTYMVFLLCFSLKILIIWNKIQAEIIVNSILYWKVVFNAELVGWIYSWLMGPESQN